MAFNVVQTSSGKTSGVYMQHKQKRHLNSSFRFIDVNLPMLPMLMFSNGEFQRKLALDCMFLLKSGLLKLLKQKDPAYYKLAELRDDSFFSSFS